MTADPDTLSGACYAPGAVVLPDSPDGGDPFTRSRGRFERLLAGASLAAAGGLAHGDLEAVLEAAGRELLCQVMQDHLDARAARECRLVVVAADERRHGSVEAGHVRPLRTVFVDGSSRWA